MSDSGAAVLVGLGANLFASAWQDTELFPRLPQSK